MIAVVAAVASIVAAGVLIYLSVRLDRLARTEAEGRREIADLLERREGTRS